MKIDIEITDINAKYRFHTRETGLIGIYGKSGSGKSQLLDCISGYNTKYNGIIETPNQITSTVYMFQKPTLFNHWNLQQNINFILKYNDFNKSKIENHLIQLGLTKLLKQMPHQLSGGEFQRAAFLLSLLQLKPNSLLILDEPFSAMDTELEIRAFEILNKIKSQHYILMVSHNLHSLYKHSNELVLINNKTCQDFGFTSNIIQKADLQIPLANILNLNNKEQLVYASDISISLEQLQNTSLQYQLPCRVQNISSFENHQLIELQTHENKQKILVEISNKSLTHLKLDTQQNIFANFKEYR